MRCGVLATGVKCLIINSEPTYITSREWRGETEGSIECRSRGGVEMGWGGGGGGGGGGGRGEGSESIACNSSMHTVDLWLRSS